MKPSSKLLPIQLPAIEKFELANGLPVRVMKRGWVPLTSVRLLIRLGSGDCPPGKSGIGGLMLQLLRRGTKQKTAQAFMEQMETLGAELEVGIRADCSVISATFPTPSLGEFFALLTEMLCEPALREEEFERLKKRTLARLKNDLDEPSTLISRALAKGFWGTHPYGLPPAGTAGDLESMRLQDVEEYYRGHVGPKISRLYVAGDALTKDVLSLCEKTLGTWVQGPALPQTTPAFERALEGDGVLLVNKPEQTQVQFRLAAKGVAKGHPEVFPLAVVGTLLGGMFTSRLVNAVRVKRGLSYHAGCYWDQRAVAGAFVASSFTKPETAKELAEVVLREIETLQQKGPTLRELSTVQQYLCGCFPMAIQTNEAFLASLADMELYGLPENWMAQYRDKVLAVDMKQARKAAKEYLPMRDRLLVFSGDANALGPELACFGGIRVVELSELS
jgi:zinc protease